MPRDDRHGVIDTQTPGEQHANDVMAAVCVVLKAPPRSSAHKKRDWIQVRRADQLINLTKQKTDLIKQPGTAANQRRRCSWVGAAGQ